MDKENIHAVNAEEPTRRITRARSKALGAAAGICSSSKPSFKQDLKRVLRGNSKRAASDESKASVTTSVGLQHKRRAVLKDTTNISRENLYLDCMKGTKIQATKLARRGPAKPVADVSMETPSVEDDVKTKLAEELSKIRMVEAQEITLPVILEEREQEQSACQNIRECNIPDKVLPLQTSTSRRHVEQQGPQNKEDELCDREGLSYSRDIVDIDSSIKDPQACSLYAPDIYNNIRVNELNQRPYTNYMEQLQQDITPSMRGILIDWLVEVTEEYKLVPDTLYLAVNLIDRFLSYNCIVKQKLQLLGVTCMLIASKYEEICAPRVEEFCFITDNTYNRGEVLKMESQVLNFLHFQLSVPTTKTFLRRFIQAAQASYKVPSIEVEFLANYLAELTLLEYKFLKFLPSLIAASAIFLARWTLDQSNHPWNPTLEHYTSYKASELKTTVLALEELQLNTNGCPLNAIREKYRQQKFKCVASMYSSERVLSIFAR